MLYINPKLMTKEEYLEDKGIVLANVPRWHQIPEGCVAICLIDNISFTAAGIAFNKKELAGFARPDPRPKKWFLLLKEDAMEVSEWNGKE
jgi:hypothetical protein